MKTLKFYGLRFLAAGIWVSMAGGLIGCDLGKRDQNTSAPQLALLAQQQALADQQRAEAERQAAERETRQLRVMRC